MLRCVALVLVLVLTSPALAALVSCDTCGAFNAPDVVKCAVCGASVKKITTPPSPRVTAIPSPVGPIALAPPTPVPSVKTVEPVMPEPPEPAESAEPPPVPVPSPSASAAAAEPEEPEEKPARPERGQLVLESEPSGAWVRLRGKSAGNTPLRRSLEPGTYRIALAKSGYVTERLRLKVRGGETVRRVVSLSKVDEPAADDKHGKHASHLLEPSPAPSADDDAPTPPPVRGAAGTLIIELVKYGEHTTASSFEVQIDGVRAGQGKLAADNLSSRMVRTFRYQRSIAPGTHTVRLSLLGTSAVKKDNGLSEATRDFEIQVAPGRTTTLFHTWAGGIEDFARPHMCCTRGHRRP